MGIESKDFMGTWACVGYWIWSNGVPWKRSMSAVLGLGWIFP